MSNRIPACYRVAHAELRQRRQNPVYYKYIWDKTHARVSFDEKSKDTFFLFCNSIIAIIFRSFNVSHASRIPIGHPVMRLIFLYDLNVIFWSENRIEEKQNTFTNSDRKGRTNPVASNDPLLEDSHNFLQSHDFVTGFQLSHSILFSVFRLKAIPTIAIVEIAIFRKARMHLRRRKTSSLIKIALAISEPEVGSEGQRRGAWDEETEMSVARGRKKEWEKERVSRRQYKGAIKSRRPTIQADLAHRLHLIFSAFSTSLPFIHLAGIGGCAT